MPKAWTTHNAKTTRAAHGPVQWCVPVFARPMLWSSCYSPSAPQRMNALRAHHITRTRWTHGWLPLRLPPRASTTTSRRLPLLEHACDLPPPHGTPPACLRLWLGQSCYYFSLSLTACLPACAPCHSAAPPPLRPPCRPAAPPLLPPPARRPVAPPPLRHAGICIGQRAARARGPPCRPAAAAACKDLFI